MGYLLSSIHKNECIFSNGVVIIFKIFKNTTKIGKIIIAKKTDCHLNQIIATNNDGSATKLINQFFDFIGILPYTSGDIYLNVKSDNYRAKRFYERNGMKFIDQISWNRGQINGEIYKITVKK